MLVSNNLSTTFLFLALGVVILSAVSKSSNGVVVLAQSQSQSQQSNNSNNSNKKSCDLDCPTFAPCVFGYADFSERKVDVVKQLGGGGTHQSGMHCDCPIGWTGLFCDIKYDSCTSNNQARHECYNDAECMIGLEDQYGNEQLFCNCDRVNGYVGKYCETPIRDDDSFIPSQDDANDPFIPQNDDNDPFIPKDQNDDDNDPFIPKGQDDDDNDPFKQNSKTIPCGDGHCLNGGSCLIEQNISEDGTYKMNESCNCDGAYDEESNSVYRGPYCQYKSTSLCSNNGESLFGNKDYCLHHGLCKEGDKLQQGCDCNSGWTGNNCQLKILELIDGIGDGNGDGDGDDNDPFDNWIAASDDDNPIDNLIASSSSDVCGDTHCYNNGSCVQTERLDSDGIPSLSFSCDCSTAHDEKYLYAGTSCEFPSTDLCLEGDGSDFCVNHGSCVDDVLLGCNCPPGFVSCFKLEFEFFYCYFLTCVCVYVCVYVSTSKFFSDDDTFILITISFLSTDSNVSLRRSVAILMKMTMTTTTTHLIRIG
jgi:hypothetical protein